MLERDCRRSNDRAALRELYVSVGDNEAVAALDRETMGQQQTMMTDR